MDRSSVSSTATWFSGWDCFWARRCFTRWASAGGQLSVLYPMVSLGYIWTIIWSRLFFKEALTKQKFLGLGLILLGVFFVGLGSH